MNIEQRSLDAVTPYTRATRAAFLRRLSRPSLNPSGGMGSASPSSLMLRVW